MLHVTRHESELGRWETVRREPEPRLRAQIAGSYEGWTQTAQRPGRLKEVPQTGIPVILNLGASWGIVDGRNPGRPPELRDSFVAGLYDAPALVDCPESFSCIEFRFTPLAAHRFLGRPMHELANRTVAVEDLLGPAAGELTARLREAPDWERRFDLIDVFVARRLADARPASPGIAWAWRRLQETGGLLAIGALAEELGWSRRRLIARFREQIGLPPKTVARVIRFDRVIRRLGQADELRWAELAYDCGYFDQAHFNRDFREFADSTPREFLAARLPSGGVAA